MSLEASFMMLLLGHPRLGAQNAVFYNMKWPECHKTHAAEGVPQAAGPFVLGGWKIDIWYIIALGPAKSRPRALFTSSGGLQERSKRLRMSYLQLVVQMMRFECHLGPILTFQRTPWDLKNQGIL
jgi:hypothetical protein